MEIINNISYKPSKEILEKCKDANLDDQLTLLNQTIFEDSKINHVNRLKFQYELLNLAETNKSRFNCAYILNLMAQTHAQTGNLTNALDNLLNAEKKWRKIIINKSNNNRYETALNGLVLCLSEIGNIYMKMGLFDQSMEYFEKGLEYVTDDDDFFVPYFKLHYHLSEIYNILDFNSRSKEMINNCIERTKTYEFADKSRSYIYLIPSQLQLASIYMKEKKYPKSIELFNSTLKMCDKFSDVIYKQQILMTMGEIYLELSDYNKANKFLIKAEEMHKKVGSNSKLIAIKNNLSKIMIFLDDYENAKEILEEIRILAEENNLELQLIEIYNNLSKVYENLNKPDKSFLYNKKHVKLMSEFYINKNKVLLNENRKTIKDLSYALKEKYEIETAKDLEMNRKFKIRSQTTKTLYRIRENNILESLQNDIHKIKSHLDNKNSKYIDDILNKISFHLHDQSSWQEFEAMFMQIHDEFVDNLKNISTELSPKQIRFCMFIKMGMDKYDICNLLNVTTRAIEQQRYRIKKILKTDQNLDEFIQEL